jgi:hypothetical protein
MVTLVLVLDLVQLSLTVSSFLGVMGVIVLRHTQAGTAASLSEASLYSDAGNRPCDHAFHDALSCHRTARQSLVSRELSLNALFSIAV